MKPRSWKGRAVLPPPTAPQILLCPVLLQKDRKRPQSPSAERMGAYVTAWSPSRTARQDSTGKVSGQAWNVGVWLQGCPAGWPGAHLSRIALSPSDPWGQLILFSLGEAWALGWGPISSPAFLIHPNSPGGLSHFLSR